MSVILTETGELSETAREIVLDLAANNGFIDSAVAVANKAARDWAYSIQGLSQGVYLESKLGVCDSGESCFSADLAQISRIEGHLIGLEGASQRLRQVLASVRRIEQLVSGK